MDAKIVKMTVGEARERVAKLREVINDYRYHYHVLDESIMSEAAADSLKHELAKIEEKFPELLTVDSPTQRVAGKALDKFQKVRHGERMISLADVFSEGEVADWAARNEKLIREMGSVGNGFGGGEDMGAQSALEFFTDIKMDGLACALIYRDGKLAQAVTRGDGLVGEDVTMNVRTIENVPLKLENRSEQGENGALNEIRGKKIGALDGGVLNSTYKVRVPEIGAGVLAESDLTEVEVRGEIVILKADFEKLNQKQAEAGEKAFANPRNLAAGTIRQLDPKVAAARPLKFVAYDLVTPDLPTEAEAYRLLRRLGFQTSGEDRVFGSLREVFAEIRRLAVVREKLKFNTDGMVIKINDRRVYRELGVVGKTPRAAVAFKFPAVEATTRVEEIVLTLGRTGVATPVAILDPVVVAGSTVRRASLHNADEIARLDVRVGDTVIIYKAGDIIPQVKRVLIELREEGALPFDYRKALSEQYPELKFERGEGEVAYRVKGMDSKLVLMRAIEYYASRAALDIEGLGEKNVEALVEAGLVKGLPDLYRLRAGEVAKLERFGEVSAGKLVRAIEASKKKSLTRFLTGLGIRHVGAQTAAALAEKFRSVERLTEATHEELLEIDDIGEIVAEAIVAWVNTEENLVMLEELKKLGVAPVFEERGLALAGKSYVISGTLIGADRADYRRKTAGEETGKAGIGREAAEELLQRKGATVTGTVTQKTTALIIGEKPGKSKLEKAARLKVPVLAERDFWELVV